jgi:hypothetical protein
MYIRGEMLLVMGLTLLLSPFALKRRRSSDPQKRHRSGRRNARDTAHELYQNRQLTFDTVEQN